MPNVSIGDVAFQLVTKYIIYKGKSEDEGEGRSNKAK